VIILAALDDSASARPILDVASRLAAFLGVRLEAVHVRANGSGAVAAEISNAAGVVLNFRDGDLVAGLDAEVRERDATALVIGARDDRPGVPAPGRVARHLVQSLPCTIVVVPRDCADRPLRRVLVAVEGDGESTTLRRLFDHLQDRPLPEVVALHVIEPSDVPPFADSAVHEMDAFEREFRLRVASGLISDPSRVRFEIRVGDAPDVLRDATRELDADLVVLAWHRRLAAGHGRLVREMLERGSIPIALFALDGPELGDSAS
jgi:nucleotide-binding universal stress UspA family protein